MHYFWKSKKTLFLTCLKYHLCDQITFKKLRRNKAYKNLVTFVTDHYAKQNFDRFWVWLMPHNRTSLIAHQKIGFNKVIMKLEMIQKFGKRKWVISDVDLSLNQLIEAE